MHFAAALRIALAALALAALPGARALELNPFKWFEEEKPPHVALSPEEELAAADMLEKGLTRMERGNETHRIARRSS